MRHALSTRTASVSGFSLQPDLFGTVNHQGTGTYRPTGHGSAGDLRQCARNALVSRKQKKLKRGMDIGARSL
jgi:hypothetical protein